MPATPRAPARRLVIELTAAALARLLLITGRRFAYPFTPARHLLLFVAFLAFELTVVTAAGLMGLHGWHPRPV